MTLAKSIHKFFHPTLTRERKERQEIVESLKDMTVKFINMQTSLAMVLKENEDLKTTKREANYADLMRENLGSISIDFSKERVPDYLEGLSLDDRRNRIIEANELWKNPMFQLIYEHLVNTQGNFTIKQAINDAQIFTGRMNINGISLFKNEVDRCHILFEDEMASGEPTDPQEIL